MFDRDPSEQPENPYAEGISRGRTTKNAKTAGRTEKVSKRYTRRRLAAEQGNAGYNLIGLDLRLSSSQTVVLGLLTILLRLLTILFTISQNMSLTDHGENGSGILSNLRQLRHRESVTARLPSNPIDRTTYI